MLRQLRQLVANPLLLLSYVLTNPRKALSVVLVLVGVTVLAVLSFGLGLVPDWTLLFCIAAIAAYLTKAEWNRASLFVRSTAVDADDLSPGVVTLTGTAQAAADGDRVFCDDEFHSEDGYLAYRHRIERKRPSKSGEQTRRKRIKDETRAVPISVHDETGAVLVDATSAELAFRWDETDSRGRTESSFAAVSSGDRITVYGTAMSPAECEPAGVADAVSDARSTLRDQSFEEYTDGESLVVATSPDASTLVLTDRAGWWLTLRALGRVFLGTIVTAGLLGLGLYYALGEPISVQEIVRLLPS